MFRKTLLLLGCLPVFAAPVYAQLDTATADSLMRHYILRYDPSGITWFQPQTLRPGEALTIYHDYFYEDKWNTAQLIDQWTDPVLGMTHYKYQQYFDVLPVEGAQFIEHVKDGYVKFINGKVSQLKKEHAPQDGIISEQQAWAFLVQAKFSGDYRFAWEDPDWEDQIQSDMNDPNATFFPVPGAELLMALEDWKDLHYAIPPEKYRAAWKFEVLCLEPSFHKAYYVDAVTGEVFREDQLICSDGTANILTQGSQTIDTRWKGGLTSKHILHTDNNGRDIHTKYDSDWPWGLTSNIKDNDDTWGNSEQLGTTAHWMVTQAWDFFASPPFNRNGLDNAGGEIRIEADAPINNAAFRQKGGKDYLTFGYMDNQYLAVIDVAGHEYTHGVDGYTAQLVYQLEPGALDESLADIFGVMVERFAEGGVSDWLLGEDAVILRSMEDPNLYGQPDTYEGDMWVDVTNGIPVQSNDYCGVHTNSGVQNFWFYLLAHGGNGTNDNGDAYDIQPIDMDDAALIAHWCHTNVLTSGSQYVDARAGTILAAQALFGDCSNEEIQTTNAWAAVGVGGQTTCANAGLADVTVSKPSLFPNPSYGELTIKFNHSENRTLQFLSVDGSLVMAPQSVKGDRVRVNTADLPSGLYFIKIIEGDRSNTLKFVKK